MKPILIFISLFICIASRSQTRSWKEMDDFHVLVSQILHPVETGNLEPLKKNSQLLLDDAVLWQKSPVPPADMSPEIAGQLKELVGSCEKLNDAVKQKKSNKEISSLAMSTHMKFHMILNSLKEKS
jgi:hypothetical protein